MNDYNLIKVSVIVPVYNSSKYLKQCLDSILNQSLREIEIICVDDGSTDDSLKILEEYQKKDNRISIFTQKNSGAAVARNKGLDIAKGDYIAFMDPDDYYPDGDVLFSIYEKVCDNNALIAGGSLALDRNESDYKPKYETKDERFFDNDGFIKFYDYQYDFYYQRFIYKKELIDNVKAIQNLLSLEIVKLQLSKNKKTEKIFNNVFIQDKNRILNKSYQIIMQEIFEVNKENIIFDDLMLENCKEDDLIIILENDTLKIKIMDEITKGALL